MYAAKSLGVSIAALACATAVLGVAAAPTTAALVDGQAPDQVGSPASTCVATADKVARPSAVLLGEPVEVTLSASISCSLTTDLNIVLVLDVSGSMAGERLEAMKTAARTLIDRLDLPNNPRTKVGVVGFNSTVSHPCPLTNQSERALACISSLQANGGTRIDVGIEEAMKVLRRGRSGAGDRDLVREVIVVMSDGMNQAGCPPVLQAAGSVKSQGVLLMTVCLGADCDAYCLRAAASSPTFAFAAENHDQLGAAFERVYLVIAGAAAVRLTITDKVPDNMRYIEDSADYALWDSSTRRLTWSLTYVGRTGVTLTYWVEPLEVGRWPTNVEADGVFRDFVGAEGRFVFPVPYVSVHYPGGVRTPSGPAPPPSATPTASPSPSATPTPTPRARRFFLPYVRFEVDRP